MYHYNRTQIKRLQKSQSYLEKAKDELISVLDEVQEDWNDLTPEAQQSEKHEDLREAVESLDAFLGHIIAAIDAEV